MSTIQELNATIIETEEPCDYCDGEFVFHEQVDGEAVMLRCEGCGQLTTVYYDEWVRAGL